MGTPVLEKAIGSVEKITNTYTSALAWLEEDHTMIDDEPARDPTATHVYAPFPTLVDEVAFRVRHCFPLLRWLCLKFGVGNTLLTPSPTSTTCTRQGVDAIAAMTSHYLAVIQKGAQSLLALYGPSGDGQRVLKEPFQEVGSWMFFMGCAWGRKRSSTPTFPGLRSGCGHFFVYYFSRGTIPSTPGSKPLSHPSSCPTSKRTAVRPTARVSGILCPRQCFGQAVC